MIKLSYPNNSLNILAIKRRKIYILDPDHLLLNIANRMIFSKNCELIKIIIYSQYIHYDNDK